MKPIDEMTDEQIKKECREISESLDMYPDSIGEMQDWAYDALLDLAYKLIGRVIK